MKNLIISAATVAGLLLASHSAMAQYNRNDGRYERDGRYDRDDYRYERHHRHNRDSRYYDRRNGNYNRPVRQGVIWATPHRYNYDRHVYFPDYQVFYDPYRGGYEYMRGNRWVFSAMLPSFLANIDLGRARVQVLSGVPLSVAPHTYYNQYYRQYPPRVYRNW